MKVNIEVALEGDALGTTPVPVPQVPDHLVEWGREAEELEVSGRLLE